MVKKNWFKKRGNNGEFNTLIYPSYCIIQELWNPFSWMLIKIIKLFISKWSYGLFYKDKNKLLKFFVLFFWRYSDRVIDWEGEIQIKISSTCWFTLSLTAMAKTMLGWIHEPWIPPRFSHTWVVVAQPLGPSFTASPGALAGFNWKWINTGL